MSWSRLMTLQALLKSDGNQPGPITGSANPPLSPLHLHLENPLPLAKTRLLRLASHQQVADQVHALQCRSDGEAQPLRALNLVEYENADFCRARVSRDIVHILRGGVMSDVDGAGCDHGSHGGRPVQERGRPGLWRVPPVGADAGGPLSRGGRVRVRAEIPPSSLEPAPDQPGRRGCDRGAAQGPDGGWS